MAHQKDKTKRVAPNTNEEAHRHPNKTNDTKGEVQNVNDDTGRPLDEREAEQARNKANVGKQDENSQ